MPRIRSIKPTFFTDADLCELSALHRLLFAGLWCLADREGRLDDKPREIKVASLPFDRCNVDAMLTELAREGFIVRYEVEGRSYIAIPTFTDHQRPNHREAKSAIPPPPIGALPPSEVFPGTPGLSRGEGKGREGKGAEASVDAPEPALETLRALWNAETASPIPRWNGGGKERARAAAAALDRRPVEGPEGWREVFKRINASPFCRGDNPRKWVARPDWALRPDGEKAETAAKVLAGEFDAASTPAADARPMRAVARGEDLYAE